MADQLAQLSIRILEQVVRGTPADVTLGELCSSLESVIASAVVGVTVLDRAARTFEHAVFPSLPPRYVEALKGITVAARPGSCAHAVYYGKTVVSDDIASDDRFHDAWKILSIENGMAAIQSRPLSDDDGTSLGTLVIGFPVRRALTEIEEDAAQTVGRLARNALVRRRVDLQQELLVAELRHRMGNMFATIGAVAHSTIRTYPDSKEFRKIFDGRLSALARAHSRAFKDVDADLRYLIEEVVAPYRSGRAISIKGPALTLSPEAASAFGLAAYELATNAAKYGAFASQAGKLDIAWTIDRAPNGEQLFNLEWRESGGPPVSQPASSGFGRLAIERSLSQSIDGTVTLDFAPSGLICTIRAPLSARLASRPPVPA